MQVNDLMAFRQLPHTNLLNVSPTLLQLSQIRNQCIFTIMVFLGPYSIITDDHLTIVTLYNTITVEYFVSVKEHSTDVLTTVGALYADKKAVCLMCEQLICCLTHKVTILRRTADASFIFAVGTASSEPHLAVSKLTYHYITIINVGSPGKSISFGDFRTRAAAEHEGLTPPASCCHIHLPHHELFSMLIFEHSFSGWHLSQSLGSVTTHNFL